MRVTRFNWRLTLWLFVGILAVAGCKRKDKVFDDPYAGAKQPLGIHLSTDRPAPDTGSVGSLVTFKGTGMVPFQDSLHFYINNEEAEVTALDSAGITVKVPASASTGIGSLTVGDQIYFGPVFRVNGKLDMDPNFKATVGANGSINAMLPLSDGRIVLVGNFTDYEHKGTVKPLNRIVLTSKDGEVDRSLQSGTAADGYLSSIATLPDGRMVIGGGFSSYDVHRGQIHGITVLNKNGSLDSVVVRTFLSLDTVPSFNGGVDGRITKLFTNGNTITAVGNFYNYLQFVYGKSDYRKQRDSLVTDSVRVFNMVRFFADGSLDSSFNYDYRNHQSYVGANGPIADAYMQSDGKLIIVGRFSRYNGESVNNILRLNVDGSIDRSFKVGSGSDDYIGSIRYNATLHHFVLAGAFHLFGGEPHDGLVMLNDDGTIDESFKPSALQIGGAYRFAAQLSDGKVIVNGYFNQYQGVHRGNFMVLNPEGSLAQGYNTLGDLAGSVTDYLETRSADGKILVMLIGGFYKLNEQNVGSIARIRFN